MDSFCNIWRRIFVMINLLEKGKKLSIERGQTILVSMVKKINNIDPLAFFEAGKKLFYGQRSFWSDREGELVLVGLGSAHSIRTEVANRYQQVENEWLSVLNQALLDPNPVHGTGPILIGGFSFDPLKVKTKLWSEYEHTMLVLPQYMLTVWKGEAYLTTNEFVSKNTDINQMNERLMDIEEKLMLATEQAKLPTSAINGDFQTEEIEPEQWKQAVNKLAEEVREQVLDKVVLARELKVRANSPFSPYSTLFQLREEQPLSYLFAIESGTNCFVGATPERLVKRIGNEVLSTCLAGSIKRGEFPKEDDRLGQQLLNDQKNLHEHRVVVDMIKSSMEKGCEAVEVPAHPILVKLKNIQHLYTPVKGKARKDVSLLKMVGLLHPTPALGGFPKELALKKIREVELLDRGWYAGPVGWLDANGNGEFIVAIRSGLLQGKEASLFAGCGIVGDSDPESEYQETIIKFKPMLSALGGNTK